MSVLNWLRAINKVYLFELRTYFHRRKHGEFKFFVIRGTTKQQRVKLYKEAYDEVGCKDINEIVLFLIRKKDCTLDIYKYKNNSSELVDTWTKEDFIYGEK